MRRVALLVCVMVTALVGATGVALAAAQNGTQGKANGEVPLRSDQPSVNFVPGEVVVRTEDGDYETREVGAQGLEAVEKAAEEIEARNHSVEEAGPNFVYRLRGFVPNDPYFVDRRQDWLWNTDPNVVNIRAPGAWDDSKGGDPGVRIGVVDTGWQTDHPDLVDKVAGQRDFVDEDPVAEGNDYHGTSVAGLAAADTNNNEGVASVGFNARFVMAKACTTRDCKTEDAAPAIDWIVQEQGVKIINLSFGAIYPEGTTDPLLADAIRRAQEADALVVASAGNNGAYTDSFYPSCFEGVLGVGAVSDDGTKAKFSNTGPCVDLVAPGESLTTTFDENDPIPGPGGPVRTLYASVGGTSFTAPQVAGTAALIMARNRASSPQQIAERLEKYAIDMGEPGRDDVYGNGLLNARCSVGPAARGC
jgi:subtilisin family serine protease